MAVLRGEEGKIENHAGSDTKLSLFAFRPPRESSSRASETSVCL